MTPLLAVLDAQCVARSITGNQRTKFKLLIQAELREAATDLGYGAQALLLFIERDLIAGDGIIGLGTKEDAMSEAQVYLAANAGIWYE